MKIFKFYQADNNVSGYTLCNFRDWIINEEINLDTSFENFDMIISVDNILIFVCHIFKWQTEMKWKDKSEQKSGAR